MIVVDVNVLAYLLINGPETAESVAVMERDANWVMPLLWQSEWRNILAKQMQHRGMILGDAIKLWDHAASLLRQHEYAVDPQMILGLVAKYPLTAYDAEYVALALHLNVPLITFDQKLQSAIPATAISAEEYLKGH